MVFESELEVSQGKKLYDRLSQERWRQGALSGMVTSKLSEEVKSESKSIMEAVKRVSSQNEKLVECLTDPKDHFSEEEKKAVSRTSLQKSLEQIPSADYEDEEKVRELKEKTLATFGEIQSVAE